MSRRRSNPIKKHRRPETGKKEYRLAYYDRYGKRRLYWLDTADYATAKQRAEVLQKRLDGEISDIDSKTFDALSKQFFADKTAPAVSVATEKWYRKALSPFLAYLKKRGIETLQQAKGSRIEVKGFRAHLARMVKVQKKSTWTVNGYLRAAKAFCSFCELDSIARHDFKQFPTELPDKRIVTEEQYAAMLDKANDKYKLLIKLLWHSGARLGEILGLTWAQVDLENTIIVIRGKRKTKRVPIPALAGELNAQANKTGYVIPGPNGRLRTDTASRGIVRIAVAAKALSITAHDFRRTFITRLEEAGASQTAIKEMVGHVDIRTTEDHYLKVSDDRLRSTIDLLQNAG